MNATMTSNHRRSKRSICFTILFFFLVCFHYVTEEITSFSSPSKKLFEDTSEFLLHEMADRVKLVKKRSSFFVALNSKSKSIRTEQIVYGVKICPSSSSSSSSSFPNDKLDVGYNTETEKERETRMPTHDCVHKSLKQEIIQLEERLLEQLNGRHALEEVLGLRRSSSGLMVHSSMPKPAVELIKETAVLEMEFTLLEQYILLLYRKAFDSKVSFGSSSLIDKRQDSAAHMPERKYSPRPRATSTDGQGSLVEDVNGDPQKEMPFRSVPHCRLALMEWSVQNSLVEAAHGCCSPPLPTPEDPKNGTTNLISLAEHLGERISDLIPETPNRISEDMVRCICAIYSKLSNAPLPSDALSSPCSSSSRSAQAFSPRNRRDSWSPGIGNSSSFDVRLENPFNVQGLGQFSGPYSTMVEVTFLYQESRKSDEVNKLLQNYRFHLITHAFLAYGIPRNNAKRVLLLYKEAYNVGGHTISAGTIQSFILGCRMSRSGQWLRLLLLSRTKFKTGDERQAYVVDRPEPLLHFALSCRSHSDPAVHLYTPRGIFQEMEAAKEEYIRATFGVSKDHKLLPRIRG